MGLMQLARVKPIRLFIFFLIIAFFVTFSQVKAETGTLVLKNGIIITMDKSLPNAEAVLIKNGVIIEVGDNSEILENLEPGTKIIDLEGRTVLPGFIDSHAHWLNDRGYAWGEETNIETAMEKALQGGWTTI